MANVNSTWIANVVAVPTVATNEAASAGRLKEAVGVATVSATQASGDTIRLTRVPSNARISDVVLCTADATTAGAINIGIWRTAADGGAVVDADLFASALDLSGGPFNNTDVTFESGEYTYAEMEKPLWEVLGLTSDPSVVYDVVAQVSTTFNGGGTTMGLKVRYV